MHTDDPLNAVAAAPHGNTGPMAHIRTSVLAGAPPQLAKMPDAEKLLRQNRGSRRVELEILLLKWPHAQNNIIRLFPGFIGSGGIAATNNPSTQLDGRAVAGTFDERRHTGRFLSFVALSFRQIGNLSVCPPVFLGRPWASAQGAKRP
jgi:hypothetical protein